MSRKHRRRNKFHRRTAPGASPGMIVSDPCSPQPVVHVMAYGPERLEERTVANLESLREFVGKWPVTWINVDGLGDADMIRRMGEMFKLHPLALEDVVNVHQRAKVEHYADQLFLVVRMAHPGERLETEQVSIFLGKNFVITFQETLPGDSFEPVRERIRAARGQIRQRGCDYLTYALIDSAIDSFFPVLETLGEQIESLEEEALAHATRGTISRVHDVKHDLLTLRRAIWPAREALHALARDPCPLITDETRIYFRDCYDHTIQLLDLLETYRELGADLRDLYLSSISNRMNEIIKVLTIISTIFIPLTFIVGVYGMNFDTAHQWNMPELRWRYGYLFVWGTMAAVVVFMLYFFRRKGWIGAAERDRKWEEQRAKQWQGRERPQSGDER
jgi:magnesium transporter